LTPRSGVRCRCMAARFDEGTYEASFMIIEYRGKVPQIGASAFVAPTAVLIGDVQVGEGSSIWFGAVLRGDNGPIRIGARTSVQDNAVVHVSEGGSTVVGDDVTVGHGAVMEDCTIERYALIGSNATLLNGCTIGEGTLIAAGSVVAQKASIPPRVVAAGSPAVVKKAVEGEAASWIEVAAKEYVELSRLYLAQSIGAPEDQDLRM
jgi:carbonic anhydrase/acetyltransferase-like protein (isoleucine patch superfamily)